MDLVAISGSANVARVGAPGICGSTLPQFPVVVGQAVSATARYGVRALARKGATTGMRLSKRSCERGGGGRHLA